jgi:hypothetical protein
VQLDNCAVPFTAAEGARARLRSRIEVPRTFKRREHKNIRQHVSFILEFFQETPR